jgi:hypothetical protein
VSEPEPPEQPGPPAPRPLGLDPDRAIAAVRGEPADPEHAPPRLPPPAIDTRRYQWMIGGFGLVLVFIFSIYLYAHNGSSSPGVAPGKYLHKFVAPLATSDLNVAANAHPRCDPAHPASRGLNVCGRRPIVLAFFALGASRCEREVDALQALSSRFPRVQFAAVAVNADRADTARLVRSHHWTMIPVAFDLTGLIGQLYGVSVCPIVELAGRGGRVEQRLIGYGWEHPAQLAGPVRRFEAQIGAG